MPFPFRFKNTACYGIKLNIKQFQEDLYYGYERKIQGTWRGSTEIIGW